MERSSTENLPDLISVSDSDSYISDTEEDSETDSVSYAGGPLSDVVRVAAVGSQLHKGKDARPYRLGFIGHQNSGKTTAAEHISASVINDENDYANTAPRKPTRVVDLDSVQALRRLSASKRATTVSASSCPANDNANTPAYTYQLFKTNAHRHQDNQELLNRFRLKIQRACTYNMEKDFQFKPLGLWFPPGNMIFANSTCATVISGGKEGQVLLKFFSRERIHSVLNAHLAQESGKISFGRDEKKYYKQMWELLTPPGTNFQAEMEAYLTEGCAYIPPILDLVKDLVDGPALIFRSRVDGVPACLISELLSLHNLMFLVLQPGADDGVLEPEQRQLLEDLAQQVEGGGLWAKMLEVVDDPKKCKQMRQVLTGCIEHLQLFLPSRVLTALSLELLDALGVGDGHPLRLVMQRQMEETLDAGIIRLDKDFTTSGALIRHLIETSPFFEAWLEGQVNPNAEKKALYVMLDLEKEGLAPPHASDSDSGKTIGLEYLKCHGDHFARCCEMALVGARSELEDVIKEHCAHHKIAMDSSFAKALAYSVPIFASLPCLGFAVLSALHREGGEQMPDVACLRTALAHTNVVELLAVMAQGELQEVAELQQEMCEAAAQAEKHAQLRADMQAELVKHRKELLVKGCRNASATKALSARLGEDSQCAQGLHELLHERVWKGKLERDVLSKGGRQLLAKDVWALVGASVEEVVRERVLPLGLNDLRVALTPVHEWHHRSLPLAGLVCRAIKQAVNWEPLVAFLDEVKPLIVDGCKELMCTLVTEHCKAVLPSQAGCDIDKVLEPFYKGLTDEVGAHVTRALFKSKKGNPKLQLNRLLERVIARYLSDIQTKALALFRKLDAARGDAAMQSAVCEFVQKSIVDHLAKDLNEEVAQTLYEQLVRQLKKRLFRPYKEGSRRRGKGQQQAEAGSQAGASTDHSNGKEVMVRFFKDFTCTLTNTLMDEVSEDKVAAAHLAAERQSRLATRLAQLATPEQLARLAGEAMGHSVLAGELPEIMRCARLLYGQLGSMTLRAGSDQQEATRPPQDWVREGQVISPDRMQAFKAYMQNQNLELLACPGADNNCALFAVLSQTHDIARSAEDVDAWAMVQLFRVMVVSFLEHHSRLERQLPPEHWQWRNRILGVHGAEDPREQVVQEHLAALSPSGGSAMFTDVDLAALVQQLEMERGPVQLEVYGPMYPAAQGYRIDLGSRVEGVNPTIVRIANVPAGGAGQVNHFEAVRVRVRVQAGSSTGAGTSTSGGMGQATPSKRPARGTPKSCTGGSSRKVPRT